MSTPTPHLGLTRPAQTDFYNINVFNENARRIDDAIRRMDEGFIPPENTLTAVNTQTSATVARTVNVAGAFARSHGTIVWVKFQNRVTAANATLNVNSTGAARMVLGADDGTSLADFITPDRHYCFMFTQNGTSLFWHLLNPDGRVIPRLISTTAAGTAAKVATLTGFERDPGAVVWVTFSTQNTAASPSLNINSTGAAPIVSHSARQITTGRRHAFAFDGVSYQLVTTDVSDETELFGTVATVAGTAAKVATVPGFVRQRGATVWLRFTAGNTAASPTLNINATNALPIQFNGAALPSGAMIANGVYGFVFDGTAWQIVNPASATATVAAGSITMAHLNTSTRPTNTTLAANDWRNMPLRGLPATVDLNTIRETGFYQGQSSTTVTNGPAGVSLNGTAERFTMQVLFLTNTRGTQTLYHNSGAIFHRSLINTTWTQWSRLVTSTNQTEITSGQWSPTMFLGVFAGNQGVGTGTWTRIGNTVTITFSIAQNSLPVGSSISITGIPFVPATRCAGGGTVSMRQAAGTTLIGNGFSINAGANSIIPHRTIVSNGADNGLTANIAYLDGAIQIFGSITYTI